VTASDSPFARMSDRQVLECAAGHLREAAALPHGSLPSKRHFAKFRQAMTELEQREAARVMQRLARRASRMMPR